VKSLCDSGFFDHERGRVERAENPLGVEVVPVCPECTRWQRWPRTARVHRIIVSRIFTVQSSWSRCQHRADELVCEVAGLRPVARARAGDVEALDVVAVDESSHDARALRR